MKTNRLTYRLLLRTTLLLGLVLAGGSMTAKPRPKTTVLSAEEEQRFLYYFYEAQRLIENEDYENGFALIWFCYGLNKDDAMVNQYLGDYHAGYRRPQAAAEFYERSAALDPTNTQIYYRLEDIHAALGNFKKALRARDEIDRREGYDAYSAMHRYRIHAMAGETKKAIRDVDDYLKKDPKNVQFLMFRAQLLEATHAKPKRLAETYERILAIEPYEPTVLNNYAYLLATNKGDLKKAEQMSRISIQAEPQNPTFLDTYAWILYLQGEKKLAKLYIQNAVRLLENQEWPAEIAEHFQKIMQDNP